MAFDVSNFPAEIQAATIMAAATLIAGSKSTETGGAEGMMGMRGGRTSSSHTQVAELAKRILEAYASHSE